MRAPMPATPRVTVLLPVFNGERYLRQAIASILGQTWRDLELLVIDDGSSDASATLAASYADARVRLHRHPSNQGLLATLNEGLDLARGEYVARMDADDVAHRDRLARQVRYLDAHPEVAVLGTGVRNFGESTRSWTSKCDPSAIRARLLFESALTHSSVMLRLDTLRRHGLHYDPAYPHAEDWALWVAITEHSAAASLPGRLQYYRTHAGQVSKTFLREQLRSIRRLQAYQLARLGVEASEEELDLHDQISSGVFTPSVPFLERTERWLCRVAAAGHRVLPAADAAALEEEVAFRWARVCRRSPRLAALRLFRASPLGRRATAATWARVALGIVARTIAPGRAAPTSTASGGGAA